MMMFAIWWLGLAPMIVAYQTGHGPVLWVWITASLFWTVVMVVVSVLSAEWRCSKLGHTGPRYRYRQGYSTDWDEVKDHYRAAAVRITEEWEECSRCSVRTSAVSRDVTPLNKLTLPSSVSREMERKGYVWLDGDVMGPSSRMVAHVSQH